ncbi:6665_t:CDS:10 [Funneliformis caledonium]|uniref:6665_t:CDS:1 n=1 Tax=Funneliformis caledonium TaxID=1117310 RepID=A0A9N8WLG5_9GLOM|nr:6665_t:CDS:10 [Funneliformis caledonium]
MSNEIHELCEGDYQIAISNDGKFAATFNTKNLQIKILRNPDYRNFNIPKKNNESNNFISHNQNESEVSVESNQTYVVNFDNIQSDITVTNNSLFEYNTNVSLFNDDEIIIDIQRNDEHDQHDQCVWSFGLSNVTKFQNNEFIFVVVSRMKGDMNGNCNNKSMICLRVQLSGLTDDHPNFVYLKQEKTADENIVPPWEFVNDDLTIYDDVKSGICKFLDECDENYNDDSQSKICRFVVFNRVFEIFGKRYEDFYYKKGDISVVLKDCLPNCMDRIVSCFCKKYFLNRRKNNLDVYYLSNGMVETGIVRVKSIEKYTRNTTTSYAIDEQNLHLCVTRGIQSIEKFKGIERIHLAEFVYSDEKLLLIGSESVDDDKKDLKIIIWDLYDTDEVETIPLENFTVQNLSTRLASTSGNLLQVDDKGIVTSVLKMIEISLKKDDQNNLPPNTVYFPDKQNELPFQEQHNHYIYFCETYDKNNFNLVVDDTEPWAKDEYKKTSFYLRHDKTETLQLVIGRSTIQIWHQILSDPSHKCEKEELPNEGRPFLEYIWTNGIAPEKENEENRLHIKEIRFGPEYFKLEVNWKTDTEKDEGKSTTKHKTIEWKNINGNVKGVIHACKALKYINKCKKILVDNNNRRYQHIIWRFIEYKPDQYRLLDVRHNVMKNLILGDCVQLIKYILFGKEDKKDSVDGEFIIKHLPRRKFWKKNDDLDLSNKKDKNTYIKDEDLALFKKEVVGNNRPRNDLELAIYYSCGRKKTSIVAYLLEYYSRRAKDPGWMVTVPEALPLLYKYRYDHYVKKLFQKPCFYYLESPYKGSERRIFKKYKNKLHSNSTIKSQKDSEVLKLHRLPLPEFTMHKGNKPSQKKIVEIFWFIFFIFIPQWYNKENLSPFARMMKYNNNSKDMFDNPAVEAVIDYYWPSAKNFFYSLLFRYYFFGFCSIFISLIYVDKFSLDPIYIVAVIIIFYYLAIYLLITETHQILHYGVYKYLDIFNWFDMFSVVIPVVIMSIVLIDEFTFSDGFGSKVQTRYIISLTGSNFIIFFQMILCLRMSEIATYTIFYVGVTLKEIWPLIVFIIIIIYGLANTMFTLFKDPSVDETNSDKLKEFIDIPSSIKNVYFWVNGDSAPENFATFAIATFIILASFFIVVVRNMLIPLMSAAYDISKTKGRQAFLRYRAGQLADYEALHHFWPREQDPTYIPCQAKTFEEWCKIIKNDKDPIYKDFEEFNTSKYANIFKVTTYDKVSIWKFDNQNDQFDKKHHKCDEIEKSSHTATTSKDERKPMGNDQEDMEELENLIEHLLQKYDNQKIREKVFSCFKKS